MQVMTASTYFVNSFDREGQVGGRKKTPTLNDIFSPSESPFHGREGRNKKDTVFFEAEKKVPQLTSLPCLYLLSHTGIHTDTHQYVECITLYPTVSLQSNLGLAVANNHCFIYLPWRSPNIDIKYLSVFSAAYPHYILLLSIFGNSFPNFQRSTHGHGRPETIFQFNVIILSMAPSISAR